MIFIVEILLRIDGDIDLDRVRCSLSNSVITTLLALWSHILIEVHAISGPVGFAGKGSQLAGRYCLLQKNESLNADWITWSNLALYVGGLFT